MEIVLAGLVGGPVPQVATPAFAWGMLYSCVIVGVGGYALFFVVIRRFGASNAAALQLLSPPVAALIGWALLGEKLAWGDLAGGTITLAGLLRKADQHRLLIGRTVLLNGGLGALGMLAEASR